MAGSVSSEDGDIGFQIAPMVDVVFVLLMFFMACAGVKVMEKHLPVELPAPSGNQGTVAVTVFIDISADGTVSMNDRVFGAPENKSLSELKAFLLQATQEFGQNDPVVIRPAADTLQERVIEVLNACVAGKVKKLTFG